jgi:D-tagatose-1,6-bisphosphate aldolase subunit GatZ/KbaZ
VLRIEVNGIGLGTGLSQGRKREQHDEPRGEISQALHSLLLERRATASPGARTLRIIIDDLKPVNSSTRITDWVKSVVQRNRRGEAVGFYSVCSANPWVIEAAMRQALDDGTSLCIESTSNQVNQFGGYTGQTSRQFADFVGAFADRTGLPRERVLLGGDHLGPYPWRKETAAAAMEKACEMVRQCVQAGYAKIHLDASMRCGDDPDGALNEKVIAERSAVLCEAAERARGDAFGPVYVVGTEVPVPGGEQAAAVGPSVTRSEDAARTLEDAHAAFAARDLKEAWERVVGLVVQPGVEFGDAVIFEYVRDKARSLSASLPGHPELVYEAHSTDYQTPVALRQMVEDHFAILKVGPWLTFAFREAVYALAAIEQDWLGGRRGIRLSRVREALETAMLHNPVHWQPYYHGEEADLRVARTYSYSDRSRYYWPDPEVHAELERLVGNLSAHHPPLTLLSQYLPAQYEAVRAGVLENLPSALIEHRIRGVLGVYSAACKLS